MLVVIKSKEIQAILGVILYEVIKGKILAVILLAVICFNFLLWFLIIPFQVGKGNTIKS